MKKEFLTYEQAKALKELGFDEKCLWYYTTHGTLIEERWYKHPNKSSWTVNTPLKQQAFRFFREKFGLAGIIEAVNKTHYEFYILPLGQEEYVKPPNAFNTYEEAESACIDKLIELAKEVKNGDNN